MIELFVLSLTLVWKVKNLIARPSLLGFFSFLECILQEWWIGLYNPLYDCNCFMTMEKEMWSIIGSSMNPSQVHGELIALQLRVET